MIFVYYLPCQIQSVYLSYNRVTKEDDKEWIMRYQALLACVLSLALCSCATTYAPPQKHGREMAQATTPPPDYSARIPHHIQTSEKVVVVDPNVHVWGAYDASGDLVKAGLASAGSNYCRDLGRRCHTKAGTFRINSLGSPGCKSSMFPMPHGGAPMPYCMFFNKNQALHGSPSPEVVEGNVSHGCVRMHIPDAEWLRYNFATVGTKVVVKPY